MPAWRAFPAGAQDYIGLRTRQKVQACRTPRVILDAQRKAWDAVVTGRSAENALFARVVASQKARARRVVYRHNEIKVDLPSAYVHHFGQNPLA
mgnify:CR=1 FL=1